MRLHLRIGVRHRISYIDFIASIHEIVIKTHGPEAALLLRVQIIDLLLVGRGLISYVLATLLVPAALAILQIPVRLR